jgi:hypothetical protein
MITVHVYLAAVGCAVMKMFLEDGWGWCGVSWYSSVRGRLDFVKIFQDELFYVYQRFLVSGLSGL